MPCVRPLLLWCGLLLPALFAGCQNNPFGPQGQAQLQKMQQDQQTLIAENRRLVDERVKLDRDNQEHSKLLAQSQQLVQQRENELALVQNQLREVTGQLAQVQSQKTDAENQAQALLASSRRHGGATIKANNSLRANLPQFTVPGVQARVEGDLVRISIAADQLFQSGTATLLPDAPNLIDSVAAEISRRYGDQIVGIEGHTDTNTGQWSAAGGPSMATGHQVSVSQAGAVYEQIAQRGRLRAAQMFVVGFGPNHPLYSNADPAGRAANRRVELVIYPDRVGG
jgi:flagellar motor protein MotB